MKVLIIGLGSMGKRRIRLIKEMDDIELFGVDNNIQRCKEVSDVWGVECFNSLEEAFSFIRFDTAFVCTSPLSHANIIKSCLDNNLHVFSEINLVADGYSENVHLAQQKGLVLFLSSTFLYREETKYIINRVKNKNSRLNYIYHVGQYLPDWHPWESYNKFFIGDSRTNGCREIMAIDMPWLWNAFGPIKSIKKLKSKNTNLNIDFNDNYLILIEHRTGAKGVFAADVVTRSPIRHIDVFGEDLQLSWDGTPDSLLEYDFEKKRMLQKPLNEVSEHIDGYATYITENPYREEIKAFFSQIRTPSNVPAWDFEKDLVLLGVIDEIEA